MPSNNTNSANEILSGIAIQPDIPDFMQFKDTGFTNTEWIVFGLIFAITITAFMKKWRQLFVCLQIYSLLHFSSNNKQKEITFRLTRIINRNFRNPVFEQAITDQMNAVKFSENTLLPVSEFRKLVYQLISAVFRLDKRQ